MSIYKNRPGAEFWSYRFQYQGKRYGGVCYGCRGANEANAYETRVKAALMRLGEQKTLNELFENCKDMIIQGHPIYLKNAYDLAMEKPRRRSAGAHRMNFKRKYWGDFVFFMERMHPDITVLQKVTPTIAEQYIAMIRAHGNFEDYFHKKPNKYANLTLNDIHATLIQVFNLLKNDTGLPENPFAEIEKLPAKTDSHEPYTLAELQLIFAHADKYLHPIFMIGLFSGLRLGDICTLRKKDICFDRHFIIRAQNKTQNQASIPMHPILEKYIKKLYDQSGDEEYLLPEHAEQYNRTPSTISNRVSRFLSDDLHIECMKRIPGRRKAVNVKGIHSLRHTFCTIAGVVGIPEAVVRSIVGHMTPEMTRLYSRHIEENEKLHYIQLFGERIEEISALPLPPLPQIDEVDPMKEKIRQVAARGGERDRLVEIIRLMPLIEAQKLLVELQERFPSSVSTTQERGAY